MNSKSMPSEGNLNESRIGIPIRFTVTSDGVAVEVEELQRFANAESHLRAALRSRGLELHGLGYSQAGCAQYRVLAGTLVPEQPRRNQSGDVALDCRLREMIDHARRGADAHASSASPANDTTGGGVSRGSAAVPRTPLQQPATPEAGAPEPRGDARTTPEDIGVADGTRANLDRTGAVRLHHHIRHGPESITLDGRKMPWAAALTRIVRTKAPPKRRTTCTLTGSALELVDRHGSRIRAPKSLASDGIREGEVVELEDVRKERVLVATISNQAMLAFNRDEGDD